MVLSHRALVWSPSASRTLIDMRCCALVFAGFSRLFSGHGQSIDCDAYNTLELFAPNLLKIKLAVPHWTASLIYWARIILGARLNVKLVSFHLPSILRNVHLSLSLAFVVPIWCRQPRSGFAATVMRCSDVRRTRTRWKDNVDIAVADGRPTLPRLSSLVLSAVPLASVTTPSLSTILAIDRYLAEQRLHFGLIICLRLLRHSQERLLAYG